MIVPLASACRSALVLTMAMGTLLACSTAGPVLIPLSAPTVSLREMMECHECIEGERDSVVARGPSAVPLLAEALLQGAPADRIAEMRNGLLSLRATTALPAFTAVIDLQLEDFHTLYRVRAALALGAIGGTLARQALCSGQSMGFPRLSVRRAIDSALSQTGGVTCP